MRERSVVRLSVTPSTECSCSASPADIGEWEYDEGETRRTGFFRRKWRRLRFSGLSDVERINPDRLADVPQLGSAEIGDLEIEPPLDLPVCLLGRTDRAGLGDALQPCSDIKPITHEIAVDLLDHVAEMNADPKVDPMLRRDAGVADRHAVLHPIAQRTASTTLRNSTMLPSPVRLTMRPRWTEIVGSMRSLRKARSRASVRSSSAPASRL
jgi:hypothetical protein